MRKADDMDGIQQSHKAETLTEVYVATDDERIYNACKENDINVIMTSDTHKTGTDRIGEVARKNSCGFICQYTGR